MPQYYTIHDTYEGMNLGLATSLSEANAIVAELNTLGSMSDRFQAYEYGDAPGLLDRLLEHARAGRKMWRVTFIRTQFGVWQYDRAPIDYVVYCHRETTVNTFLTFCWAASEHEAIAIAKEEFNELLPTIDQAMELRNSGSVRTANELLGTTIRHYDNDHPIQ